MVCTHWNSSKFRVKYNHTLYDYFNIIKTYKNMIYEYTKYKYIFF